MMADNSVELLEMEVINIKNHQGTLLGPLTTIRLQRVAGGQNMMVNNLV
jgi:hypothetical protein